MLSSRRDAVLVANPSEVYLRLQELIRNGDLLRFRPCEGLGHPWLFDHISFQTHEQGSLRKGRLVKTC